MTAPTTGQSGGLRASGGPSKVVGLLLLIPPVLGLLGCLVYPSITTIWDSFQRSNLFSGRSSFAGLDNYVEHGGRFAGSLLMSIGFAILPMVIVVGLSLLYAAVVSRSVAGVRIAWRLVLTVPLVGFAPAATVAGVLVFSSKNEWFRDFLRPENEWLARVVIALVIALVSFGVLAAIGTMVYLAAFAGKTDSSNVGVSKSRSAVGVVVVLLAIGTIAMSLQAFVLVFALTGGGPGRSTMIPSVLQFEAAFRVSDVGGGAAISTMLGLILGVLGLAAGLVIVLSKLRIQLRTREETKSSGRSSTGATIFGVVLLISVVVLMIVVDIPRLSSSFSSNNILGLSVGRVLVNTLLPSLLGVVIQVALAFVGGLAIGAFRPLGRHSEFLLLPFSPWLFVSVIPLGVAFYQNRRDLDWIGSFLGLVPPVLLSIPALFVFTLFFAGQHRIWQATDGQGSFSRIVLMPALPLVALVGMLAWITESVALYWPLLVGQGPDSWTISTALVGALNQLAGGIGSVVWLGAPLLILGFIVVGALQVFYVDRLILRVGDQPEPAAPGTLSPVPAVPPIPTLSGSGTNLPGSPPPFP